MRRSSFVRALAHVRKVRDQIREFRIWNRRFGESAHPHTRPGPYTRGIPNV